MLFAAGCAVKPPPALPRAETRNDDDPVYRFQWRKADGTWDYFRFDERAGNEMMVRAVMEAYYY